jgi:hypothetical protein
MSNVVQQKKAKAFFSAPFLGSFVGGALGIVLR